MNVITNILYWISTGLLVPVIVLLIFFFAKALILAGSFFGEYLKEKRSSRPLYEKLKTLTPDTVGAFASMMPEKPDSLLALYAGKIIDAGTDGAKTGLLLSEYEEECDREIASSKILAKMGPVLGLMGTLIPMGPALTGLASGDIASMASNMQVAFATTVVGLVVSAIGFLTQQAKERWAVRNLAILEYLAEILRQPSKK